MKNLPDPIQVKIDIIYNIIKRYNKHIDDNNIDREHILRQLEEEKKKLDWYKSNHPEYII